MGTSVRTSPSERTASQTPTIKMAELGLKKKEIDAINFCQEERKTIYWIKSPTSSSTCQWGYSPFSIQPFFHHLAIWGLDHSAVYNIPSSTLTFTFFLQDISLRDFCNFINCLLELS